MPSSAKDRFTVDFEPIFFFVKSRKYWFESIKDPCQSGPSDIKKMIEKKERIGGKHKTLVDPFSKASSTTNIGQHRAVGDPSGRNRRCVWTIPTQPYPESHFATFPESLVEPMIKAGCPSFVCKKCGKAREKIIKPKFTSHESKTDSKYEKGTGANRISLLRQAARERGEEYHQELEFLGYTDCGCNAGFRPGIVLDPFCGSGTVMRVAERLNRVGVGFDLGYTELQEKRMKNVQKEIFG